MEIFAQIVMLAWIPVVLLLFAWLPPRRAVITAFLTGFLFLPMASYKLPILPDYTKMSATCAGIFIGAICFDTKRILSFSPRLVDLPIAVFCVCPFFSSLVNGLGLWDGLSAVLSTTVTWGVPYLIGRLYFTTADHLKELAIGIIIGGLIYIPFCLFEMRMSPQLHRMFYGAHQHSFGQTRRFGGWRPTVFMQHGLMVASWMATASLVGLWLWWTGAVKRVHSLQIAALILPLVFTAIYCRSIGALVLLFMGLAALKMTKIAGARFALWGLLLLSPIYIVLRVTGSWHGEPIPQLAEMISSDRAGSFQFRIDNEDMLISRAMQSPIFGWGGWGRNRVFDDWGNDISTTDGLWIIELGTHGLLGLSTLYAMLLVPLGFLLRKYPTRRLVSPEMAPAVTLAVAVTLFAIDCLPNGMINPVMILAGGAVIGFALEASRTNGLATIGIASSQHAQVNSVPPRRLYPNSI